MTIHKKPGESIVLFGFDDSAFPFQTYVEKHLLPGRSEGVSLEPGPRGSHDEILRLYGTVIWDEGRFKTWYMGSRRPEKPDFTMGRGLGGYAEHCVCYAESEDGFNWTKPNLGLVNYGGTIDNNLIELPERETTIASVVLLDADETDLSRRYKMAYEAGADHRLRVAYSFDGLRWSAEATNPVGPFFEMAGIMKHNGFYIVNGHDSIDAHHPYRARLMASLISSDFVHWSPIPAVGMDRSDPSWSIRDRHEWNNREEIHLGAALWDRGNVVIGIYGQWHGHTTGDRRQVSIDLGLAISNDGLGFREPIPDFKLLVAAEQADSPIEVPALVAGQGMTNFGEKTLLWFSLWRGNEGTGIRVAEWERDRLGYLSPFKPEGARVISAPLLITAGETISIRANVSGTGTNAGVRVVLLDENFQPLSGYGKEESSIVDGDSLDTPILWSGKSTYTSDGKPIYGAVDFLGIRPEDVRLHALYIT